MSISGSLSNALSGLAAASRAADVVSSNVANAMTEGFARRELDLSSRSLGGNGAGVVVNGVNRIVNTAVLADRRLADAQTGNSATLTGFYTRLEGVIGESGTDGSLTSVIDDFESALIESASRPDSEARLASVLSKAQDISAKLNTVSKEIETIRTSADSQIGQQVDRLNKSLLRVDELNAEILAQRSSGRDATALMDERQTLVDTISEIVPVREVARDHNQISLYTTGGAILLEGNAQTVGFTPLRYRHRRSDLGLRCPLRPHPQRYGDQQFRQRRDGRWHFGRAVHCARYRGAANAEPSRRLCPRSDLALRG